MEASLDALPGLLEGLSLGALGWVVGTHAHDVRTGEDQDVGHYLEREGDRGKGEGEKRREKKEEREKRGRNRKRKKRVLNKCNIERLQ
jgi:hypothetical protein